MKSDFSVRLADKICGAWDGEGGTPVELNSFAENNALVRGILAVVRGEAVVKPIQPPTEAKPEFQFRIGKTIKLGLFKAPDQYRSVLNAIEVQVGTYAGQILDKVTISSTVTEVDLSEPFTVADLGFTDITPYGVIKKRIIKLGGELCPNEVGPAMRFQYMDQPKGDWFRVAMEGLPDVFRDLRVFFIGRDVRGLWLSGNRGYPSTLYDPDRRFVCVVPRKK